MPPPRRHPRPQDRCALVPHVFGRDDATFLGVFDGTVGEHASDFVHHVIAAQVCGHEVRGLVGWVGVGGGGRCYLKEASRA